MKSEEKHSVETHSKTRPAICLLLCVTDELVPYTEFRSSNEEEILSC